jgi:hypothetical protein
MNLNEMCNENSVITRYLKISIKHDLKNKDKENDDFIEYDK